MNTRIKELRTKLKMNQTEFGKKIGIQQSSVASIELGRSNPSNQALLAICREFGVSEEWLREGTGEMFVQKSPLPTVVETIHGYLQCEDENIRKRLTVALAQFTDAEWDLIESIVDKMSVGVEEVEEMLLQQKIEAETEAYRQELTAELKGGRKGNQFPKVEKDA